MRKAEKDNYAKIRERFNRRFSALQDWLADPSQHIPKAWYESGNPIQGVPISKQLPIYQPDKKLTPQSLRAYLQEEQQAHQGARLLSIPLYINPHWVVLTLYIDKDNQLGSAAYVNSVMSAQGNVFAENQPIPLKRSNPLYQALQSIYPNFKKEIQQYQHYLHEGNVPSEFAMVENAGQMVKRFYFGHRFPVTSTLWSGALTPTFEQMPDELRLYITSLLGPVSQAQLAASSQYSRNIVEDRALDQSIWKRQYQNWMRYVVPPIPNAKEPECYKTAFKRLYLSLTSLERRLIKAALAGDKKTLNYFFRTQYKKSHSMLSIIATVQGDIGLLKRLNCVTNLIKLPLISYSMHAPNRQAVLDYFWGLVCDHILNSSQGNIYHKYALWATMLNQVRDLKYFIWSGDQSVAKKNVHGIMPYLFAKYFEHQGCVALLEEVGASTSMDVNAAFERLSRLFSSSEKDINSLLVLLAHIDFRTFNPYAMGMEIESSHIIRLLLAHGTNINAHTRFGNSILHNYSYSNSDIHTMRLLLAYGADPHIQGSTALNIALNKRNYKAACLLAIAMYLKPSSRGGVPTLQEAHDYHPKYFRALVREILDGRSPWLWITDEMRGRLKASPLVHGFEYQKKIQFPLRKKLRSLPEKLANPTEHMMPKASLEDPPLDELLELQLPIYQPSRKVVYGVQGTLRSLSNYLQYDQRQHDGERLLVIPIYVKNHWAVLVLRIDKNNQPAEAHFVDSLGAKITHLDPFYHSLQVVYPNFQGPIQQHQRYYHSDKSLSEFIMIKNAEEVIKHIYFEDHYLLTPIPWTTISMPTFESVLPEEVRFGIISRLGLRSRMQISATSQDNHRLADSQELWERSYQNWSRYVIPPAPGIKKPTDYNVALKKLYMSLTSEEKKLINAVIAEDQVTVKSFVSMAAQRNRLLIIAACHGDIKLLKTLKCRFSDLRKFALIQYSIHAKNRQAVLNYFWSLVRQPHVRFRSISSKTLSHWAAMLNQIGYLIDHLEVSYQEDIDGITPLMYAEYNGHIECIELLRAQESTPNEKEYDIASVSRKLTGAVYLCEINNVLILLAQGADPNYRCQNTTALINVATGNRNDLLLLLAHGADPNIKSEIGTTPLLKAVSCCDFKNTRLLLLYGADPDLRNSSGMTALMIAVRRKKIGIVYLLLSYNADPFLKNDKGKTALDFAEEAGIKRLLFIAMYLKSKPKNKSGFIDRLFSFAMQNRYLKQAHHYSPVIFKALIKDIFERNAWPWVTKEMKQRLLNDPFIRSLDLTDSSKVSTSTAQKSV